MSFGKSGGSGSTKYQKWQQYVPPEVYSTFKWVLPKLADKYDTGLTGEEKGYYTGQMRNQVGESYEAGTKSLADTLARSGISPTSGAATESSADLLRGKMTSEAQGHSAIQGMDIQKKDANTDRLLKMLMANYDPQATRQQSESSGTQVGF